MAHRIYPQARCENNRTDGSADRCKPTVPIPPQLLVMQRVKVTFVYCTLTRTSANAGAVDLIGAMSSITLFVTSPESETLGGVSLVDFDND